MNNKAVKKQYLARLLFLIGGLLLMFPLISKAQNVTVDVSIDSLQRFIGEQAHIKLEVSCDAEQKVLLPQYNDTLVTGVEIIDISKADTQYLNNQERMLITQIYTVTSFDSASYYIPPFDVMVNGTHYQSKSLAMMVYPMELDQENPEAFFPPKSIMPMSIEWQDWQGILWKILLIIPLVILCVYLVIRYRDNKPIIRKVKIEPKLPPHQLAMQEIERIKAEKSWQKGDPKGYYTDLTDVIRIYIHERFGYNAMEKTSSEIIDYLMKYEEKEAIEDLKQLFVTADLVKFAKHSPLLNENDMNLVFAVDFINQTKQEIDPNEKQQPTEITVEEKRSKRVKIALIVGIFALVSIVLLLGFYVGRDLYYLFF